MPRLIVKAWERPTLPDADMWEKGGRLLVNVAMQGSRGVADGETEQRPAATVCNVTGACVISGRCRS
ncbi:hypothetical protein BM1_08370 [Bipolaris maydis]|nr:hypothetical protein BM1_08370 [Bipolaris maydis]